MKRLDGLEQPMLNMPISQTSDENENNSEHTDDERGGGGDSTLSLAEQDRVLKLNARTANLKQRIYHAFEGYSQMSRGFQRFLFAVIIISIITFVFSTDPAIVHATGDLLSGVDTACVVVFLIEYLLRLFSATEKPRFGSHPVWARLRFMTSFLGLIDLTAILPLLLLPFLHRELRRDLSAFRILRLLKVENYFPGFRSLFRVFKKNRDIFIVLACLCTMLLLTFATAGFLLWSHHDAELWGTIPRATFMCVMILTGVGINYEGVGYSIPMKLIMGIGAFVAIILFSLPSAVMASGFEEEAETLRTLMRKQRIAVKRARALGVEFVEKAYVDKFFEHQEELENQEGASANNKSGIGLGLGALARGDSTSGFFEAGTSSPRPSALSAASSRYRTVPITSGTEGLINHHNASPDLSQREIVALLRLCGYESLDVGGTTEVKAVLKLVGKFKTKSVVFVGQTGGAYQQTREEEDMHYGSVDDGEKDKDKDRDQVTRERGKRSSSSSSSSLEGVPASEAITAAIHTLKSCVDPAQKLAALAEILGS